MAQGLFQFTTHPPMLITIIIIVCLPCLLPGSPSGFVPELTICPAPGRPCATFLCMIYFGASCEPLTHRLTLDLCCFLLASLSPFLVVLMLDLPIPSCPGCEYSPGKALSSLQWPQHHSMVLPMPITQWAWIELALLQSLFSHSADRMNFDSLHCLRFPWADFPF